MKMPLTHADLLLTIAKGDTGATVATSLARPFSDLLSNQNQEV